jgi:hypothetical protein
MEHGDGSGKSHFLLILILIVMIMLFRFDIRGMFESKQFQDNTSYIETKAQSVWNLYLQKQALYIWNNLFTDTFIKAITDGSHLKIAVPKIDPNTIRGNIQLQENNTLSPSGTVNTNPQQENVSSSW